MIITKIAKNEILAAVKDLTNVNLDKAIKSANSIIKIEQIESIGFELELFANNEFYYANTPLDVSFNPYRESTKKFLIKTDNLIFDYLDADHTTKALIKRLTQDFTYINDNDSIDLLQVDQLYLKFFFETLYGDREYFGDAYINPNKVKYACPCFKSVIIK